ncbi:MAG: nuclear transport factor 2 family protein [Actinomycetota bacterium]|nr:nuclear transport factor 2 family protein [Actinomycetota bacterium]
MPSAPGAAHAAVSTALRAQVQQFYVHQLGLLDDGRPDDWVELFTEDADFLEVTGNHLHGRDAIRESIRRRAEQVATTGLDFFRHWLGMLQVSARSDGSLQTRSCALAMYTPSGGTVRVYVNVVCEDSLVWQQERWMVRSRHLRMDGR